MRKEVKKQILQLLTTLLEAHEEIYNYLQKLEYDTVRGILAECQDCAVLIGNTIEQFESEQQEIIGQLEEYCELLYTVHEKMRAEAENDSGALKAELDAVVKQAYVDVEKNIRVVLKVVFMPYKASMWTSLSSVWEAAEKDPDCEAKVVVIPYYNLDRQQQLAELVYEADLFPKDVPVIHYSQYDVATEHPDMIFIHNPYDGMNNVTRVPEQYYSYNLKKCTEQLIYSPYGMMGYYNPSEGAFMCITNAVIHADKVLVQSEKVKQIYIDHGVAREKLIALGSPKVDAVVEKLRKRPDYPEGWEERLKGRKVFLVNTHLSYFIKGYVYAMENPGKPDFAKWSHEKVLEQLLNREGVAMIWRPHPLLKTTLKSRNLYESLAYVEELEERVRKSNNAVVDEFGEYDVSFGLSDALVTTYSSLIAEFMITEKPVYVFQKRLNMERCRKSPVSYENIYCRPEPGENFYLADFVRMVLREEDFRHDERMKDVHRAFPNLEGTIGKNIYQKLKSKWND